MATMPAMIAANVTHPLRIWGAGLVDMSTSGRRRPWAPRFREMVGA
jgi:hypothetical protein